MTKALLVLDYLSYIPLILIVKKMKIRLKSYRLYYRYENRYYFYECFSIGNFFSIFIILISVFYPFPIFLTSGVFFPILMFKGGIDGNSSYQIY